MTKKKVKVKKVKSSPIEEQMNSYNVTFAHDYAVVMLRVDSKSEEEAPDVAIQLIKEYYGWDISFFDVSSVYDMEE